MGRILAHSLLKQNQLLNLVKFYLSSHVHELNAILAGVSFNIHSLFTCLELNWTLILIVSAHALYLSKTTNAEFFLWRVRTVFFLNNKFALTGCILMAWCLFLSLCLSACSLGLGNAESISAALAVCNNALNDHFHISSKLGRQLSRESYAFKSTSKLVHFASIGLHFTIRCVEKSKSFVECLSEWPV